MLPFLALKELFKIEIFRLNLKDSSNMTKVFLQNTKNGQTMSEFYALLLVLSGRFGDSYRRAGVSVCIRGSPG